MAAARLTEAPTRNAGENTMNLCFGSRSTDASGCPDEGIKACVMMTDSLCIRAIMWVKTQN